MFNLPFQPLLCIDTCLLTIESGNESAKSKKISFLISEVFFT